MLLTARRLRLMARIFLALILSLVALLAVAVYLLQRNPEALTRHYLDELSARTGLTFRVEAVDVVLLPVPSIAVSNGGVEGPDLHFTVAYATLRPDFLDLLRGRFTPRSITLLRPRLYGKANLPLADFKTLAARFSARSGEAGGLPALPEDCRLAVVQGQAELTSVDGTRLQLLGLQCRLDVKAPTGISGRVQWGTGLLRPRDSAPVRLDGFLLEGGTDLAAPLTRTPQLTARGALRLPPWLAELKFTLHFSGGNSGWTARTDLRGDLLKDSALLPFFLTGTAAMRDRQDQTVSLENFHLGLGPDSGRLSARLSLGGMDSSDRAGPNLAGRLQLHRASLTQWLGFARKLAPGLQLALDNLTDASLDFRLDGKGLVVPNIVVRAAGSRFTGSGGVASWARPEVALDLKTDRVNLGLAIPEAVGKPPLALRFDHGPLTPMPGGPLLPGETGLDYNIRLAAQRVDYGPLVINDALVVISPGKLDPKTRLEDTLLSADGRLYGGSVRGDLVLGGGPELPYAIKMRIRDVDGAALGRALPVLPVSGGRLRGDVAIMSQGRELDEFLSKLRGSVTARAENGALRLPRNTASGTKTTDALAFSGLDLGLKINLAAWENGRLGLDGQWQGALQGDGLEARADFNGRFWFSGDGADGGNLDFQNLPGSLDLRLSPERSTLPEGLQARVAGRFSCQAARSQLSVQEAHLSALGVEAHGQALISAGRDGPSWQGRFSAYAPDLNQTLRRARGVSVKLPGPLRALELEAAFKGDTEALALSQLRAKLDQTTVTGSLAASWRKELSLEFQLAADQLNLDSYLEDRKASAAKGDRAGTEAPAQKKAAGKAWDLRFLRTFRAKGELRVKALTAWRFKLHEVRLPVTLEKGRLTCEAVTGRFYGAPLHSRGFVDFTQGMTFENSLSVENFDLTAASKDRGGSAALGGRASLSSEVRATLTGPGQLPKALNGRWRFTVLEGVYQQREPDGQLKGKVTRFDAAGASGNIAAGVARSSDFYLKSPDLKVNGGGWIDLNNETLDCNFTVNMKSLPDFPLRLYGSLSDSKTSIGAGKLILNTLGGITQGFVDVLGGIVQGTWRLFR